MASIDHKPPVANPAARPASKTGAPHPQAPDRHARNAAAEPGAPTPLSPAPLPPLLLDRPAQPLRLTDLVRSGVLDVHDLPLAAQDSLHRPEERVPRLIARRLVTVEPLYRLLSRKTGYGLADLSGPVEPHLIDRIGTRACLTEGILPLRRSGGATLVAAATPEAYRRALPRLRLAFGKVTPQLASPAAIAGKIAEIRGPEIAERAESRVPADLSCRYLPQVFTPLVATLVLATAALLTFSLPWVLASVTLIAILSMTATTLLKFLAFFVSVLAPPRKAPPPGAADAPVPSLLPTVSIIVALYHEDAIAPRLIRRLGRLDYPKENLDVLLVVEEHDDETRAALARCPLPPWMRVVVAPAGRVMTKPRALNFALDFCRGSIVGIYDAEDAPEPDQISRAVAGFAAAGPGVVCLQGQLDYYNPRTNWLSRSFTLEYGAWFRAMLPGLERMGLPIPLGGTTLFFRRAVLEDLGGWDAWNVTEDADLGLRLARAGWRTAILPSTTYEEANCRPLPWIKQRSRWLKGYMITYLSHMRAPARLWRELGTWGFAGVQLVFLGTILQGLLAPVLWTWWGLALGWPSPLGTMLSPWALQTAIGLFLLAETANFALGILGLQRSGQRINPLWLFTLPFYYPLQSLAAWKALWEVLHLPFYWSKTRHGIFDSEVED